MNENACITECGHSALYGLRKGDSVAYSPKSVYTRFMDAWGSNDTQYFFELTPDRILDAVEESGLPCTGRAMALNSMENRVYEVEIELPEDFKVKSPSERFRIVKFYRPGRWSRDQILEEHQYLQDLIQNDIPVVAPQPFEDGSTLKKMGDADIYFTVFPKVGGRSPQELGDEQLQRIGRLLARMHNVGASRTSEYRIPIQPDTYAKTSLNYLMTHQVIPRHLQERYQNAVLNICELSEPWFSQSDSIRIHGDCHLGNLLWNDQGPFWVDFDDMVRGPAIQDIWLVVPGRDQEAKTQRSILLEAYEQFRDFDYNTLKLIEPLRALRFIHFSGWIGKRWQDPAFPRAFPHFGSEQYWQEQVYDLEEQLRLIQEISHSPWQHA